MKRYCITFENSEGRVWTIGGPLDKPLEAVSIKAAAQMFWNLWTTIEMPKWVKIEEVPS